MLETNLLKRRQLRVVPLKRSTTKTDTQVFAYKFGTLDASDVLDLISEHEHVPPVRVVPNKNTIPSSV